jgi:ABC-type transport system involved in multi-copper enzyme maturation permease subunit
VNKLSDFLSSLALLQQQRLFKMIASGVIAFATIAACIAYAVAVSAASESTIAPPAGGAGAAGELDATSRIINDILAAKQSPVGFFVGAAAVAGIALLAVWLNLGITYAGLALFGAALFYGARLGGRAHDLGIAAIGLVGLIAAFTALLQGLRLLFMGSGPVMAVARTVLAEAVRIKVSLVFIVLIVLLMAVLPLTLDTEQPLRYRVQSFLQFSTSGAFWLIAILILTFTVSSVTLEQRDKVIWQTMTKPVAAWQYLLGKWLGVTALAGALLLVAASGVFIFTEYLRTQPAQNENQAYVAQAGQGITEDRLVLETQILTARATVRPNPPALNEEQFAINVEQKVDLELRAIADALRDPGSLRAKRAELRETIADSLRRAVLAEYRAIDSGQTRVYTFAGLSRARESNRPIILRFKFDSGANRPDSDHRITLILRGGEMRVVPLALGQFQTFPLTPDIIDSDGTVELTIINGDLTQRIANPEAISFAPEAMEISYAAGGFRANFFRCIAVLWIKLGFLAMLAIAASTFLSFPVACLVSFTIFLAAEGSGFIAAALENYATEDREGNTLWLPTVIAKVAETVSGTFRVYADLRPTSRIVEGLLLSWSDMFLGVLVLTIASLILFAAATLIFQRRELATYSGH